ncbi:MAG: hypothetical protein WBW33_38095 [Bryobacteraceae bacterium]
MRVRICWKRAQEPPGSLLPFPASHDSRIAQVGDCPILNGPSWFYVEWWEALRKLQPDILAGHRDALRRLAELAMRRRIDMALGRAVFILTRVGERPLPEAARDQLWHAFGVPIHELYVTGNGIVLASECEAHNGWHVHPDTARISKLSGEPHLILNRLGSNGREFQAVGMGFAADVTTEVCDCGQSTPRVVNLPVFADHLALARLAAGACANGVLAPPAA